MNSAQIQALSDQAVRLYEAGRMDEAEHLCVQLRGIDARNFIGCYLQGIIQFVRDERGPAQASMEAAMAAAPYAPQPLLYQGRLLEAEGNDEKAIASYSRALALQPDMVEALVQRGGVHQRAGRLIQALTDFELASRLRPDFPPALFGRALALASLKRPADALTAFDRLLALDPGNVQARYNHGAILLNLGNAQAALADFELVLARAPELASAHANRGQALKLLGRQDEAIAAFERSLEIDPGSAGAWNNRGIALHEMGRLEEAMASLDRALALQPGFADAWNNRGVLLRVMTRREEALACYDKAVAIEPDHARAWNNRGVVLLDLNRAEEALPSFEKAAALRPDYAQAWIDRGAGLQELKKLEQALASVEQAIKIDPKSAEAWSNRSAVLMAMNRPNEALVSVEKALSLSPDYENGWNNRGSILSELKRFGEAAECYRKAIMLKPDHDFLFGHYLFAKLKVSDWDGLEADIAKCAVGVEEGAKLLTPFSLLTLRDDPALQHKAARIYTEARHPRSLALGPILERARRGDKISLGYYSADFHHHATCFLIAELLEAHDPSRFELFGFSFGPDEHDDMRQRIQGAFHKFMDVRGMTDREVARLSRELGIDIAVDLKGHTQQARTGIFAEGAAPIQVQYLGYPGTMGADYIDYVIGDGIVIPPGAESDYAEKVVRLPHSYQPNDSRRKISEWIFTRTEAGLPESGFVFCCFNNNQKILPDTFDSWMRILKAIDGSVLWLLPDNGASAESLRAHASARGVDGARLIFASFMKLDEHLARHRLADLFLDTWPYNAHTTASDALWAGLPVVTHAGKSFAGRVAASLLNAVGLPGLVTNSPADYEALAIALARDPEKLAALKKSLADNRTSSPLFDGRLIARHLEAAYNAMLARHRAGLAPDHIEIAL